MESTQENAKDNGQNKTETVSVLLVDAREENSRKFAECLSRMASDIEEAIPLARQLFYDFAHLRKGQTIGGCFTQDQWAQKYAHRTARALRYMFEGGNPVSKRLKKVESHLPADTAPQLQQLPALQKSPEKREDFGTHGGALPNTNSPDSADYCAPVEPERILSHRREPEGFPQDRASEEGDQLQRVQAKLSDRNEWIRAIQSLMKEINPKDVVWSYLNDDQKIRWEKYVEREP